MHVILEGYIVVSADELEVVQKALVEHTRLTRLEDGCLQFEVVQDVVNQYQFNVYEEFINQTAFELHQTRARQSRWGLLTKNVERHYQIR
ncbi:putative quinol monooxygenase [Shewanella nanhaiensis]|uniref:Antibiotic biosynthesis monooxygenase n=1 Tax=Shewanella nanhaiensis TaxID=2864872 RepID=A0ABS7E587_9GAMM|nr:antibiotic biosynthesis monooxygenase [Shewanella nanhaiensis]